MLVKIFKKFLWCLSIEIGVTTCYNKDAKRKRQEENKGLREAKFNERGNFRCTVNACINCKGVSPKIY